MPDQTSSDHPSDMQQVAVSALAGSIVLSGDGLRPPPLPSAAAVRNVVQMVLEVPDGAVGSAVDQFIDSVTKFGLALNSEAARLELDERADGQRLPEVTGSMVIKANDKVRNPPVEMPPPPPVLAYVSQVFVVPTSIVAGAFGSYLDPLWSRNLVGVVGFGLAAVACQTHAVFALRGRRRRT